MMSFLFSLTSFVLFYYYYSHCSSILSLQFFFSNLSHLPLPPAPLIFFFKLSFFSHSVLLSYTKLFSVSFTRYFVDLPCSRVALIFLPSISPSHLHYHDAFPVFLFLFLFRIRCFLVFLFFNVFTYRGGTLQFIISSSLSYSCFRLFPCAHLSTHVERYFLFLSSSDHLFLSYGSKVYSLGALDRLKISQTLNVFKQERFE